MLDASQKEQQKSSNAGSTSSLGSPIMRLPWLRCLGIE
uniref:Uncharacterized protein n=1 Tax=Vibrio sp. F12 FF_152 TaxID=1652829 RepID=A0A0H3ZVS3_9VIBR|nr:hypothetical protein [Vibrio sp. F12 FF_152]